MSLLTSLWFAFFSAFHLVCATDPDRVTLQVVPLLVVFGDSIVDVGNNNFIPTVARANFPPYGRDWDFGSHRPTGRFSNGRIAIDFIAQRLGLPFPVAYLNPNGTDNVFKSVTFASSASGFLDDTRKILNIRPLSGQLKWYSVYVSKLEAKLGRNESSSLLSKAVFVLSTGVNDLLDYYLNPALQLLQPRPKYYNLILKNFRNFMKTIYQSGARKVAVTGMPPVGCLPAQITTYGSDDREHCVESQNKDARDFNQLLISSISALKLELLEMEIVYLDIYSVLADAAENPEKYGFAKGTRGCCGTGRFEASILCNEFTLGTCKNASKFVFWDAYHPSDSMNEIIGNELFTSGFGPFSGNS